MFEMALSSAKLFFAGKLFKDPVQAIRRLAIGIAAGALVILACGFAAPLWLAAIVGGAVAGALQPILYKNLKFN